MSGKGGGNGDNHPQRQSGQSAAASPGAATEGGNEPASKRMRLDESGGPGKTPAIDPSQVAEGSTMEVDPEEPHTPEGHIEGGTDPEAPGVPAEAVPDDDVQQAAAAPLESREAFASVLRKTIEAKAGAA